MTAERRIPATSKPTVTETSALGALGDDYVVERNIMNEIPAGAASDENYHGGRQPVSRQIRHAFSLMISPLTDETGSAKSVVAGLCTLFVVGAGIGLATPKNPTLPTPWYRNVSAAIGYIYFLAWSVSFYPQVVSNFKRRSTVGLSSDFCVLNVLGFACYTAYNMSFFFSKTIQDMYRKRHGSDAEITVQSNDVAFALHAFILSSVTVLQIMYYGGGIRALNISKPILTVIAGILTVCAVYPTLIVITQTSGTKNYNNFEKDNDDRKMLFFNWLDYLYVLSFVKITISLIKYIPQVILNVRRKSTVGWSIWNILLDFTGGVLSDLQLILDCFDLKDFSGITGNPAKFGLGFVSIIFDVIFMVQHYCLYPVTDDSLDTLLHEQQEPLLPPQPAAPPAEAFGTTTTGIHEGNDGDGQQDHQQQPETILV